METTAVSNHILLSQDTVDYLIFADKGHWEVPREETIAVKGKGKGKDANLLVGNDIEPIFQRASPLDKESQRKFLAMHESIGSISNGCPTRL
jgi:hypothetical protein